MALQKPKKTVFQIAVKEGVEIPETFTIPAKVDGVDTTVTVNAVKVGEEKGESVPTGGEAASAPAPAKDDKKKSGKKK